MCKLLSTSCVFGETKVRDAWLVVFVDDDVGWLQVAVNNLIAMRVFDGPRDGLDMLGNFSCVECFLQLASGEIFAGDELHGEKVFTIHFSDLKDIHNMRML